MHFVQGSPPQRFHFLPRLRPSDSDSPKCHPFDFNSSESPVSKKLRACEDADVVNTDVEAGKSAAAGQMQDLVAPPPSLEQILGGVRGIIQDELKTVKEDFASLQIKADEVDKTAKAAI